MSETDVKIKIAEIILSVVKDPAHPDRIEKIVKGYHISRRMLTPTNLLNMKGVTFFRLMMGISETASRKEYDSMHLQMADFTAMVGDLEDGTPEGIINAHIGTKKFKKSNNKEGK